MQSIISQTVFILKSRLKHCTKLEDTDPVIRFFYLTRNILGLLLVISPLAGFLCIDYSLFLSPEFLCGLAVGVPLALRCYNLLPFRLWTGLYVLLCCGGFFLCVSEENGLPVLAGVLLAGLGYGGLALILPANLIVSWFRFSKTLLLGLVWSGAFAFGLLWKILLERITYPALLSAGALMLLGVLFFLERPPRFLLQNGLQPSPASGRRLSRFRSRSARKVFFYTLIISFALSFGLFLAQYGLQAERLPAVTPAGSVFWFGGLLIGPLLAGLFINQKGVYSGCVLLIFLTEVTIMCFGFENDAPLFLRIGYTAVGAALGMLPVLLPILAYYLYGPAEFSERLAQVLLAVPAGLAAVPLLTFMRFLDPLTVNYLTFAAMFLLMISFFIIFSAWKHRFVLLKY